MNRLLLEQRLAELDSGTRQRLARRAGQLRDEARRRSRTAKGGERKGSGRNLDAMPHWAHRLRDASLEDWVLRLLEDELMASEEEAESEREAAVSGKPGTIVWVGRKLARLAVDGQIVEATLTGALQRQQRALVAVGDMGLVDGEGEEARLVRVLPRRTLLSRPDPHDANLERVVAANVDVAVIVASVASPPLRAGLIDRVLVIAERGGCEVLLCLNKVDLLDADSAAATDEVLAPYLELGLSVCRVSARTGEGMAALAERLAGKTAVLLGHSGAGKSSLLNVLSPGLDLRTGEVNGFHGKGRHTTTSSTLHGLGAQTWVIDTPGVRSLGLGKMAGDELRWFFPEFSPLASECAFRDCAHDHEPDCAVRRAVEAGTVPRRRHEGYLRLLRSLDETD